MAFNSILSQRSNYSFQSKIGHLVIRISVISIFPLIGFGNISAAVTGIFSLNYLIPTVIPASLSIVYIFGKSISHNVRMRKKHQWLFPSFKLLNYSIIMLIVLNILAVCQGLFVYKVMALPSALSYILYLFFTYLYFCIVIHLEPYIERVDLFFSDYIYSLCLYMLINVCLFLFGIDNPSHKAGYLGELTSIFPGHVRSMLPMPVSISFGAIHSCIVGISSFYLLINKTRFIFHRLFFFVTLISSLFFIIGIGNRMTIICFIITCFLILVSIYRRIEPTWRQMLVIILIPFIFPIIWCNIFYAVDSLFPTEFLSRFVRGSYSDIYMLGGRVAIWSEIINYYIESNRILPSIIGYGIYGQITSGVVYSYNSLFLVSYANTSTAGAHNEALAILLTNGILGVLALFFFLWFLFRSASIFSMKYGDTFFPNWIVIMCPALIIVFITEAPFLDFNETFTTTFLFGIATTLCHLEQRQVDPLNSLNNTIRP